MQEIKQTYEQNSSIIKDKRTVEILKTHFSLFAVQDKRIVVNSVHCF